MSVKIREKCLQYKKKCDIIEQNKENINIPPFSNSQLGVRK